MNDNPVVDPTGASEGERNTLLIAYVLYGAALITGLTAVIGVIINYIKLGETSNEFLRSHHRWLIRTFWFFILWTVVCALLWLTFILIPVAWLGGIATGVWYLYRLIRGLINFAERRPMPV